MDSFKIKPARLLVGRHPDRQNPESAYTGKPFAVAPQHIVSVTGNDQDATIAYIRTDSGELIVCEDEDGVIGVLNALGADYHPAQQP